MAFQEVQIMNSGDYTLYTLIILVLSFVYYYYKYRHTRTTIQQNNLFNNNPDMQFDNNNANNQEEVRQFEQNVLNRNLEGNQQFNSQGNNGNQIKIFTLINNVRKEHSVDVNIKVDEFIRNHLSDIVIPNNKKLMLICKGKRLELNRKLSEVQVTNETVIHGFMIENTNPDSNGNQENNSNYNNSKLFITKTQEITFLVELLKTM